MGGVKGGGGEGVGLVSNVQDRRWDGTGDESSDLTVLRKCHDGVCWAEMVQQEEYGEKQ